MVFSYLLMTIYISTTQHFCCVACGWNLFYNFQTVFQKLQCSENVSLTNLKIFYQCFYSYRIRWLEANDLVPSLFLIKKITGGGFRCIYQVLFESTFSNQQCGIAFSNISLLRDNSDNLFPMDLGNSRIVGSGWCEFTLM